MNIITYHNQSENKEEKILTLPKAANDSGGYEIGQAAMRYFHAKNAYNTAKANENQPKILKGMLCSQTL